MRVRNLSLVIVMAGLSFGGSFNCSDDDDDDAFVGSNSTSGNTSNTISHNSGGVIIRAGSAMDSSGSTATTPANP